MWLFDVYKMWFHQLSPKNRDHQLINFAETVLAGVIQSVRHQAQTVDTSKTHHLLNAGAHEAKVTVKPS